MPKITMDNAKRAMAKVWDRWGAHIPKELQNYRAEDIFRFHETVFTFDSAFSLTFATTFKQANGLTCPAADIGGGCGGFVTPTLSHEARLIHIHPKNLDNEFDPMGLLSHEYIHYLSHPNFYPIHYKAGGSHPTQVEGATEWLMIEACKAFEDGFDIAELWAANPDWVKATTWSMVGPGRGKPVVYVSEYQKMSSWLGADRGNLARLLGFVFKGVATDLSAIRK
jgi:hypothetical protein